MRDWLSRHKEGIVVVFFIVIAALILNVCFNFGLSSVGVLILGGILSLLLFLILTDSFWPNLKWFIGLGFLLALMLILTTCGAFFIDKIQICP